MKFSILKHISVFFFIILSFINNKIHIINDDTNIPFVKQTPPFSGTIFVNPDIIKESDLSTFVSAMYSKQHFETMYDRRIDGRITVNAFIFDIIFSDGLKAKIRVNPEFETKELAEIEAVKYAKVIGKLPKVLRKDIATISIHKGEKPFGGGNNDILIHTGQSKNYEKDGILEETLVHEASHTSLDKYHAKRSDWVESQKADAHFISTYAKDNPTREDVAETFLLYLAIKYRSERISKELKNTILNTVPNRIKYFNNQIFDMYPIK